MAQQTINVGTSANDGTGDPLRTAFTKINTMFTELYGTSGEGIAISDDTTPQLGGNLDINGFNIVSAQSNQDIVISPSGTGGVIASNIRLAGTTISSDDSSLITVAEGLQVNGATNIDGAVTATSTMAVTGATTLSSTLAVTGATTMSAGLTATSLTTNTISSNGSNADLSIQPSGTGDVLISALRVNGTTLDSSDSTKVTIAEAVDITGATDIGGALTGTSGSFSTTLAVTGAATFSGTAVVDNITINDSTISTSSNADLNLTPGGTGNIVAGAITINGTTLSASDSATININEGLIVDGSGNFSGTLTTADITTTGTHTITGQLDVDGVRILDNKIFTNSSNAVLDISAAGTGTVNVASTMTTLGQTITGTASVTGQLNADNIRIDGNAITSTNSNGAITITPDGTGQITLGGNYVAVTNELAATDISVGSEILMGSGAKIVAVTTNEDLELATNGTGTIKITNPKTQMTVGSSGEATHLPLDSANEIRPTGYLLLDLGGVEYAIPYFAAS